AEIDPSKSSDAGSAGNANAEPDFRWNEERETIDLKPGVVLVPPPLHYTYQPASSPCAAAPAKPSLFDKLKRRAEQTLQREANKADAQISKGTKGNVDGGVGDNAGTVINQADQQNPCAPAKGPATKQ